MQRWWHIVIIFLIARLIAGIVLLAIDGSAWSVELTLIIAACVAVYLLVGLAVRRWAPPRRAS
jgi:hypothetical protein